MLINLTLNNFVKIILETISSRLLDFFLRKWSIIKFLMYHFNII